MGKTFIAFAVIFSLCFALAAPALAGRGGGGFGGTGMGMGMSMGGGAGFGGTRGGFTGTRSGFAAGSSQGGNSWNGGNGGSWNGWRGGSWNGGNWKSWHGGKHFHRCCINGTFFTGFVFGSFPAPFYVAPWPWDWYQPPPPSESVQGLDMYAPPAAPPAAQLDIAATIPREACYVTGCYRLQGDGVGTPFQWIWVPAPPPPPAVIPYPSGRYELRGPSRWEWVPNPSGSSLAPSLVPSSSRSESGPASLPNRGLIRWTDDQGVTHWTQGLDAVPERYRPKAKLGAEGTL